MSLATDSILTIYSDTMAYILVIGLMFFSNQFKVGKDQHANTLFFRLCVLTLVNALSNGISYALHHQVTGWPMPVRMIMPTIAEYSTLLVMFGWFLYCDYKLYKSWDRSRSIYRIFQIPVFVMGALCVINMFTGIMFDVWEDHTFHGKFLFYCLTVLQYIYGIFPVLSIIRYIKTHGRLHFFNITPVVVPVLTAAIFTLLTNYSARSLGFAIALVFLHMSYINLWRFEDRESGFYNGQYINHILTLTRENKLDYHSVIEFETANTPDEFYNILRTEMPGKAEVIRMSKNKFLLFSESPKTSMIQLLSSMIQDSADEYDEQHLDEPPIDLLISYHVRRKNESAEDFIRHIAEA